MQPNLMCEDAFRLFSKCTNVLPQAFHDIKVEL